MRAFSIPSESKISDLNPDEMEQAGNLGSDECQDILKQRYEEDAQNLARPSEARSIRRRLRFDPFKELRERDEKGEAVFCRNTKGMWIWCWESGGTCKYMWNNEKVRIERTSESLTRYGCWYGPSLNVSEKHNRVYIGTLEGILVLSLEHILENSNTEYVNRLYTRRFPSGVAKSTWSESSNRLAILSGDGRMFTAKGPDMTEIVRAEAKEFQGLGLDTVMKWEPDGGMNRFTILTNGGTELLIATMSQKGELKLSQRIQLKIACLDISWSGNRCSSRAISCTAKDDTTVTLLDASSASGRVRHVVSNAKEEKDTIISLSGTTLNHPSSMIHINRDISTIFDVVKLGHAKTYVCFCGFVENVIPSSYSIDTTKQVRNGFGI